MTAEYRARLFRRLYLFTPLIAAIGGVTVAESGLSGFVLKHIPASLASYTNQAMNLFPFSWLLLALGCALGTCREHARSIGATGWALAMRLCFITPFIFAAQVLVCTGIAVGGCMLVTSAQVAESPVPPN